MKEETPLITVLTLVAVRREGNGGGEGRGGGEVELDGGDGLR